MNAILIDDEIAGREILKRIIDTFCPEINVLASCETLESGVKFIQQFQPDLVFLDIELQNDTSNGLSLLSIFDSPTFEVIIVSAHDKEYAMEGYKIGALDFIHKPDLMSDSIEERLKKIVQEVHKRKMVSNVETHLKKLREGIARTKKIGVKGENMIHFYQLKDIHYWKTITGTGSIQYFLGNNQGKTIRKKLEDIDKILTDKDFFRIHHSHIINLSQMLKVNLLNKTVTMNNGAILDISVSKFNAFIDRISEFTINLLDE